MADNKRVHLMIGTRKGGYIAESDLKRKKWTVKGPIRPGMDVFHMVADPRHPGDLYLAANSPFLGPMMFRGTGWGKKWTEIAPPMMDVQAKRPNPFELPEMPKYPIVNLWHVEPGRADEPSSLFLGVDPGSLYRSHDLGDSWEAVSGLNDHETRPKWGPGAGGLCLHTIALDPTRPKRMYIGISAAGTFRSDDGGDRWRPANKGVETPFLPEKFPELGQCVHHFALDPAQPDTVYRQDHAGIYVSHDGMDSWHHVGSALKEDFGFVTAVAPTRPGQALFVPLQGNPRVSQPGGIQVLRWTEKTKKFTPLIKKNAFVGDLGVQREGLTTDALDPPGIYMGTTTGQVIYSADDGKTWGQIPYMFPSIHSVSAASPSGAA